MRTYPELPFRQVHLDFHTSEHLHRIGSDFDKAQFQKCLQTGHINSMTVFATCHHGWCYYDSDLWDMHPNMDQPLLPRILDAAREIDVQTPIYLTVGWNERMGGLHPEWVVKDKDGNPCDLGPDKSQPRRGWKRICLNTPYLDELVKITEEVMRKFNPVGVFYDIVWEKPCYCAACQKTMKERGIDPADEAAMQKLATDIYLNYHQKVTEAIQRHNPEARVYHNGSDKKGRDDLAPYYSHYEIESLPTTTWCGGYEHFPQNARYFKHKGLDYLGMTGKFHQSWGEFGGYKHPDALRYETMRILMMGGKCSIGDQMLPEGLLDSETYRIIGKAYKEVEAKEAWCTDVTNVAEIAVLCPSAVEKDVERETPEIGACMMLSEEQYLFDMIDEASDFSKYTVLLLPDTVAIDETLESKLKTYLANGGSLIASGESGVRDNQFVFDYGLEYMGPSDWYIDFTQVSDALSKDSVKSPYFNYLPGPKTRHLDAEVLAETIAPHFNRTFDMFCSHGNTPPGAPTGYPAVSQKGREIYIGAKVFTMYREKGMRLHRTLVRNCIDRLLPDRRLKTDLPSGAIVTLNKRSDDSHILHILYATPITRGTVPVIEDIVPLYSIPIHLKLDSAASVILQPEGQSIDFSYHKGVCSFTLPKLDLHAMIEIQG